MKNTGFLFTPVFMAVLLLFFGAAMATATFIENDYGREAAYSAVYASKWFEFIMLLLAVNLAGQVIKYKLYRREKLTILVFHLAFIIILAGAAITRYTGFEGTMHIREGETADKIRSAEHYIGYVVENENGEVIARKNEIFSTKYFSPGKYVRKIKTGGEKLEIFMAGIIRNAAMSVAEDSGGKPMIEFIASTPGTGFYSIVLKEGDTVTVGDHIIGFGGNVNAEIVITCDSSGFYAVAASELTEGGMMSGTRKVYRPGERIKLSPMQVLAAGDIRLVPKTLTHSGVLKPVPVDPSGQETGRTAYVFHINYGAQTSSLTLWQDEKENFSMARTIIAGKKVDIRYGAGEVQLPFALKLNDFIVERYPGSNMPSGYKSDVILTGASGEVIMPYVIYMNNVLKYKGYRFYQSSYDSDEKGTVLSVNHDVAGMVVTYSGYALLFIFIILSLINPASLFRQANIRLWNTPFGKGLTAFLVLIFGSGLSVINAQDHFVPLKKAAEEAGMILVQDQKGRTEPLYTLSYDILRKVTRKNEFNGLSPMQVFSGIWLDFEHWQSVPLIRVSNSDLAKKAGISGKMASFSNFVDFSKGGVYRISEDVQRAYAKKPGERNKYDKEVIKVDERINIIYMIYTGDFLRLFPSGDSLGSWLPPAEALRTSASGEDSLFIRNVYNLLTSSVADGNAGRVKQAASLIYQWQKRLAGYELPTEKKIRLEVLYHKAKVFERLFPYYATTGILALILLLFTIIGGRQYGRIAENTVTLLLAAGFAVHTAAFIMRWHISGHAPLSNGFESMVFISWVTILAGFIFRKKSGFVMPATAILSAMTLLVAHMSFMDPEITNLVPVLKSYWLTLHVSVITSSYAFLGLGAIIGMIVMLLLVFSKEVNIENIGSSINTLTVINYRTVVTGLYLLTAGTFLGAIWANESWGRYWGWDPKETWSLITIIVYTLVTHSRMIPAFKNVFAFNLLSMLAISSVLMTYFGVNYYLSGLHSYAGGDPVPVPAFVYVAVILVAVLSVLAYMKFRIWDKRVEKN